MAPRKLLRGFTVVELMITVAVLGILLAFAVPSMTDFYDRKRLVSQTEAIANLLQFARSEAIKHPSSDLNERVTVTIQPSNAAAPWTGFVGLRNGTACDNSATPCKLKEGANTNIGVGGDAPTRVVTATECPQCKMKAPTAQQLVTFDLRGVVTGGADLAITLESEKGRQLRAFISQLGRITICSPGATVQTYPSC